MSIHQPGARSVWMIISTFHPVVGGSETSAQRLAGKLIEEHGWPVQVLTRRHGAGRHGLPAREVVDGIPVTRVWSRGRKVGSLLYLLGGLWHLLRHGRGGIYHAHDIAISSWIAVIARYLLGGRGVIKLRTGRYRYEKLFASYLGLPSRFSRWYFTTPLRLVDRVVVVNREVEGFARGLGISPNRVVCIPNAVDTSFFRPASAAEKAGARRRLDLPTDKAIFVYVGRLGAIKGVDVLLQGWALASRQVHDYALLVLVGDDSHKQGLLDIVSSPGVRESVLFVGRQRAVRDYYWAADVFVLASRTEGMSNALLEAMSCGLPAIASNVGGSPDVVRDGENGLLFESENYGQLVQRLALAMTMRERWTEMGERARQVVIGYADIEVCVRQVSELYKQLT